MLNHLGRVRSLLAGEVLFREGDPAYGIFEVLSGEIEISRKTASGPIALTRLGAGAGFGTIGILAPRKGRSATATAVVPSVVFELSSNPIELCKLSERHGAVVRITENIFEELAGVLRRVDRREQAVIPHWNTSTDAIAGLDDFNPDTALAALQAVLPGGLFASLFADKSIKENEILFEEGSEPRALYYLQSGCYEVSIAAGESAGNRRVISTLDAPAIVGEVGFFTRQPRTAQIRALANGSYRSLSFEEYDRLRKRSPEIAVQLVVSIAQVTAHMVLEREARPRPPA